MLVDHRVAWSINNVVSPYALHCTAPHYSTSCTSGVRGYPRYGDRYTIRTGASAQIDGISE